MDPVVYTALPPNKKQEYMEKFPEPTTDPIRIPEINIDRIFNGYALFYRTQQLVEEK